jgi:peptidoglycan/xylan/chitin deacetylase (PgdA/CDA1 family)
VVEAQIEAFKRRGFTPARAADVVRGRGRLLHVTFDDAFSSAGRVMAAVAARGVFSTVFVCTSLADRGGAPLEVSELAEEFRAHPNELKTMSWPELEALSSDMTVEIGSHTVTHAKLWQLSDSEIGRELRESKASIEDHVGQRCRYLAYPYGLADGRVVRAAERAGYEAAFLLLNGRWDERHALPRTDLYPPDRGLRLLLKTEPSISLSVAKLLRFTRRLSGA